MADWSDGISWQRSKGPFSAVPPVAQPPSPQQAETQRLYKLLLDQQRLQNQPRQGVYGVNQRPYTANDVAEMQAFAHPGKPVQQPATNSSGQAIDRSSFDAELKDPAVRQRLAAIAYRETGGQGPQAQQAFIESVINRAAARGKTISQTISGQDGYFPQVSLQPVQPTRLSSYGPIIDRVAAGSNVSNGATGNASGGVGFNGGPQTFAANGERFGREGPDRNWKIPYKQGPDDAFNQPYRPVINTQGEGWRDAPPMTGKFSTYQGEAPSMPAGAQVSSSPPQRRNAFQPQWNPDGTITWADGTRQQVSAFA